MFFSGYTDFRVVSFSITTILQFEFDFLKSLIILSGLFAAETALDK